MKTKIFLFIIIVFIIYSCKDNDSNLNNKSNISSKNKIEKEYIEKDKKGKIIISGNLLDGKKHGIWKYYNKGILTNVKRFQEDTLIYVLDETDYMYKDFLIEKIDSYIPIPKYWETNQTFDDDSILLTAVKKCDDSIAYCQNIVIRYENIVPNNFEDFVKKYKKQIQNSYGKIIIKGFDQNKLTTKDSYILRYYVNYNNTIIAFITIWIKDDENAIIYTASCEKNELEKNLHLLLQIGNSITKKK